MNRFSSLILSGERPVEYFLKTRISRHDSENTFESGTISFKRTSKRITCIDIGRRSVAELKSIEEKRPLGFSEYFN